MKNLSGRMLRTVLALGTSLAAVAMPGMSRDAMARPATEYGATSHDDLKEAAVQRYVETMDKLYACQQIDACRQSGSGWDKRARGPEMLRLRNLNYRNWGEIYYYSLKDPGILDRVDKLETELYNNYRRRPYKLPDVPTLNRQELIPEFLKVVGLGTGYEIAKHFGYQHDHKYTTIPGGHFLADVGYRKAQYQNYLVDNVNNPMLKKLPPVSFPSPLGTASGGPLICIGNTCFGGGRSPSGGPLLFRLLFPEQAGGTVCVGSWCSNGGSPTGAKKNSSDITSRGQSRSLPDPGETRKISRPVFMGGASMAPSSFAGRTNAPSPAGPQRANLVTSQVNLPGGYFGRAVQNPDGTVTVSNNFGTVRLTLDQLKLVASGNMAPVAALMGGAPAPAGASGYKKVNSALLTVAPRSRGSDITGTGGAPRSSSLGAQAGPMNTVRITLPPEQQARRGGSDITGTRGSASHPGGASPAKVPAVRMTIPAARVTTPTVRTPTPTTANVPTVRTPAVRQSTITVRTPHVQAPQVRTPSPKPPTVRLPTVRPPTVRIQPPTVKVQTPNVSDVALKRDIVELGRLANGLRLYRYRYIWSDTEYVGVMAQEVLGIAPDAVVRGADGYLRVDYGRLGLELVTWKEWTARGAAPAR